MPAGSPAPKVSILDDQFRRLTASRRFNATVISAFGLLALIIGAAGVHGVTASLVAQQTREIGVRMALGATATRVVRSITAYTGRLLLLGTALGLLGAWAASGVLEALAFGMGPSDWPVIVLPFCVLSIVGVSSAIVPALLAARVDPLIAWNPRIPLTACGESLSTAYQESGASSSR